MGDKCSYVFVMFFFFLRDEKDAFMDQDDLLNQDSFVLGLIDIVVFNNYIS